jgi:WD40 repeat protein
MPLKDLPLDTRMGRRGLFGAGLTASGLLAVLDGCGPKRPQGKKSPGAVASSVQQLRAHAGPVTAIAIAPDGSRIVSASADGTMKEWPYPHGGVAQTIDNVAPQQAIAFSGKGSLISQPDPGSNVVQIRPTSSNLIGSLAEASLAGHAGRVTAYSVSPRRDWLSSVDDTNKILLWSLDSFQRVNDISAVTAPVRYLAFPDNNTLLTGSPSGEIDLWAIPSARRIRTLPGPRGGTITAFAMTPDSQYVILGDDTGHLVIISLKDGSVYERITGHQDAVGALIVTPDGTRFISAGGDGTAKVWSFTTRHMLGTFDAHRHGIRSIAVGPKGDFVFTGDSDGVMTVWSWITYKLVSYFFDPKVNLKSVNGSAYTVLDSITGKFVTFTLPCGSPIPPGATCTCNCVGGDREEPRRTPTPPVQKKRISRVPVCRCESVSVCTCQSVAVCTCQSVAVCTCQGVCTCNLVCTCLAVLR